ncbi:MAG: M23 family metallopeptidase [Deltaproteobacteria bacterium]|nr:MAG: M23 family metallopeptidase [Deltaproteobacteria bacterium]
MPKHSRSLGRAALPPVYLAAIAAMAVACAASLPSDRAAMVAPVAAAAPTAQEARAMIALARVAGAMQFPFADQVIEQLVRWQHDVRDRFHHIGDGAAAVADAAGTMIPDLTVLSIEPVAHTESSGFGWRDDPIRHTRSFHSGTDFRGAPGTPVVAAGDGIVAFCGRLGGYGNVVDIDHGGGVLTRYAHLRKIETRKAATVTAGEVIGQLGSTGRTTGPHLHFEIRLDGAPVSPIAAMAIAGLQREVPLAGRLAALSLSPELQATAESDVDPPKQRAPARPERPGRTTRSQVLW